MAADANLTLQASATKTASFNGAGVDLKVGTPRRGLNARFLYSAVTNASGSNSATFSVEHSDDNSTFYALSSAASAIITMSTTAQAGEIILPFITEKRYVRAVLVIAGAGSTPTITYSADVVLTHP
jgi:hypothetical protein